MKEKEQGWVELEDVKAATFERFVTWAYTGYYSSPSCLVDAGSSHEETLKEEETTNEEEGAHEPNATDQQSYDGLGWGGRRSTRSKASKWNSLSFDLEQDQTSQARMKKAFVDSKSAIISPSSPFQSTRPNQHEDENYTNIFLCHAELYVFSEEKDIQDLKMLSLMRLHATLADFKLYENRTGDVLSLLQYAYTNTVHGENKPDALRKLLTDYIGYEMDTLLKDGGFKNVLMENEGSLLEDFLSAVGKRI